MPFTPSPINLKVAVPMKGHAQGATDMEIAAMYRDQAFGTQSEKMVDGRTIADLNAASFASYRRYVQTFNPEFLTNSYH